jgi:hypothetical protein
MLRDPGDGGGPSAAMEDENGAAGFGAGFVDGQGQVGVQLRAVF